MKTTNINEFLTKEEKEKIQKRIEKSLEDVKNKYQNVTLADKTDEYERNRRDLETYSRLQGLSS